MLLVAFLGGVLTLLSPCILPVLPLLLSRAGGPIWAPMLTLLGMATGFAVLASLAVVSSDWVIGASQWGRYFALGLLAASALALLSTRVGNWLFRPWLWLGNRLHGDARRYHRGYPRGCLAAPLACSGPLCRPHPGPDSFGRHARRSECLDQPIAAQLRARQCRGVGGCDLPRARPVPACSAIVALDRMVAARCRDVALLAVIGIASGASGQLASLGSSTWAFKLESQVLEGVPALLDQLSSNAPAGVPVLSDLGPAPTLAGATQWLNGPALDLSDLRGKVVLVDFWTYDCINCRNSLPYVNQWAQRYADQGFVVIGVHTPEYAYERIVDNVRQATKRLGIQHPVAIDNQYRVWNAFNNHYWPAHYFIDASGRIRYLHIGEGGYEMQEEVIQQLLQERDELPPEQNPA